MGTKTLTAATYAVVIAIALALGSCADKNDRNESATSNTVDLHQTMSRADMNCPKTQAAVRFRDAVLASNGTIEPIHTSDGLAVLATAQTDENVAHVRAAAQKYLQESRQLAAAEAAPGAQISPSCSELLDAVEAGKVRESAANSEKGTLVSISTSDASLVKLLQRDNCCSFCKCPSKNWQCASCC